mgnify:CR=1 FL=1
MFLLCTVFLATILNFNNCNCLLPVTSKYTKSLISLSRVLPGVLKHKNCSILRNFLQLAVPLYTQKRELSLHPHFINPTTATPKLANGAFSHLRMKKSPSSTRHQKDTQVHFGVCRSTRWPLGGFSSSWKILWTGYSRSRYLHEKQNVNFVRTQSRL